MNTPDPAGERITCNQCGRVAAMADIDLGRMLAKCVICKRVFSFADRFPGAANRSASVSRPPAPKPKRFHLVDDPYEKTIQFRWFTPSVLFLTGFCVLWDGFLVFWYTAAIGGLMSGKMGGGGIVMILFPLLHVSAGIVLTYTALCSWINATTITVTDRSLVIRHGPLPWRGSRTIAVTEFVQFYVESKTTRSSGTSSTHYLLKGVTYDGTQIKLVGGISEITEALFLEQQLEKWMGIEDQPVAGEVSRL